MAAASVSVALEIATYGLAAGASSLASENKAMMVAVDRAGAALNSMLVGGLGVAIVCMAACMWRSGLFPLALNITGVVSGTAIVGAQLAAAPALATVSNSLAAFALIFWVWMLWAGMLCWRRSPQASGVL